MRLLTGPPGSGKTHTVLEILRESARRGANDTVLLTPTATMAEHLRNEMAREGLLLRPDAIQTLWRFVQPLTPELAEIPEGALRYLVWQAVEDLDLAEFRAISAMPGFQNALTALISELDAIARLPDDAGAVSSIASRVWEAAAGRGMAPRSARFRRAAERIAAEGLAGVETVLLDGFFSLTPVELDLIRALASKASVTVTLPEWDGAWGTREQLLAMGFVEERRDRVRATPRFEAFTAPTADKEAEEIARRILTEAASGRRFREIGVVVRGHAPYVPILERAFERFGIPARFYFGQPLPAHPVVRRVDAVVESRLEGWDHDGLIEALRLMPATPDLDRLQYRLLEQLPGKGLEGIAPLGKLAGFSDEVRTAEAWAEAVAGLTALFPQPEIADAVTHEQASIWRSHAAAEQRFREAMEETANALGAERELSLREFWRDSQIALRATQLRPPDRRRNVVHVMDVYEARQWELPVVFVCGLVERQFPKHHTENALLGDAARRRLSRAGARLPTGRDRDNEERFLFELATTRATERLVLSHPLHDSRGEETRRSFFLERFLENTGAEVAANNAVRPRPGRPRPAERLAVLSQPDVLKRLTERHTTLSPSSIESFLQCPFAFFALKTLRLTEPPLLPAERLSPLVEGSAAHSVLAVIVHRPDMREALDELFDPTFEKTCAKAGVPAGYRKETALLELRDSLENFVDRHGIGRGQTIHTEEKFRLQLDKKLAIEGRVDRADFHFGRGALLVDYKYTRPHNLRNYITGSEEGKLVQAGLYLLAVRECFGAEPAGMLFCAVSRGPKWAGWHTLPELGDVMEPVDPDLIEALGETARAVSLEVAERIRSGEIATAPSDTNKCSYCAHHDICRVETPSIARAGGGGE